VQRGLLPLDEVVLQVSARASFELVGKAAMAGIPVLSTVSAPSALAVSSGRERGVTVVGFNRRGRCNVYSFPERITAAENELTTLHQQQAAAQIEVEKPFPQEEELAEKSARLAELNAQLDVDEKSHEPEQDEEEQEDEPRRPSVLAALEEKSDKPEPVKPFRSYYDKDGDAR
jgi:hypothetical protein